MQVEGQIYIPEVTYALMVSTIFVVVGFKHSASLASAYGPCARVLSLR